MNQIPIITSETLGAESFFKSVTADSLVELPTITSIATTLGAKKVAKRALEVSREFNVIPCTVTDREAVEACLSFAEDHRVIVESACGASLALAYKKIEPLMGLSDIVVIVCGGAGVDYSKLVELKRTLPR